MEYQSSASLRARALLLTLTLIPTVVGFVGCYSSTSPTPLNARSASASAGGSGTSSSGSTSELYASYTGAGTIKVIFSKDNFYNNDSPNSSGCSGDARYFYDPITERRVPVQPNWLRNVAVDITNANVLHGPSNATSCALSGSDASVPSNCAAFDDLQPLDGAQSRSILVGGFGCLNGTTTCNPDTALSDIWHLQASDVATQTVWVPQSGSLPILGASGTVAGHLWHGGDFDELHNQFYIYGGAVPATGNNSAQVMQYSNKLIRFEFNTDQTVSSSPGPATIDASTQPFYAGWSRSTADFTTNVTAAIAIPPALTGATFTYGLRRDPANKAYCLKNDLLAAFQCSTNNPDLAGTNTIVAVNEDQDYYLLAGGLRPGGTFNSRFYLYSPHSISPDVATGSQKIPSAGHWNLISNIASPTPVSSEVMAIKDIATSTADPDIPFVPTAVGGTRPDGSTFSGWVARAYHRTVYDQNMNRFYLFGGIESGGGPTSSTLPDLATSDLWIYDPPSIGRRPTAACFTSKMPDGSDLPSTATSNPPSTVLGASYHLGVNKNYLSSPFVFPPGGCLQRIHMPDSAPAGRFEHSMAFDRDHSVMLIFGGGAQPRLIPDAGTIGDVTSAARAGHPFTSNYPSSALLNDTWIYLPPTTAEFVDQTHFRTTTAGPYNASSLLSNLFSIDFWIYRFALFFGDNAPNNAAITAPSTGDVLGAWIALSPSVKPSPRLSASLFYDRAHHKFYLQGGFGCPESSCATSPHALNDLWEFTPPDKTLCSRETGACTNTDGTAATGTWTQLRSNVDASAATQPTQRYGAVSAFAHSQVSYGDSYYTVLDSSCFNQGPIASNDISVNKLQVGAIYIDINRSALGTNENLLLNIRFLPFDQKTKSPGYNNNNTPLITVDDSEHASTNDTALIRVRLLHNSLSSASQIQSSIQPRFHNFVAGTPILIDTLEYLSGPSGQVTEKQILIPLSMDPSANLIKIERFQGSAKFYEMTLSRF